MSADTAPAEMPGDGIHSPFNACCYREQALEARALAAEAALAAERERAAKAAFLALEGMRDEGENDIRIAQSRVDAAIRAQGE